MFVRNHYKDPLRIFDTEDQLMRDRRDRQFSARKVDSVVCMYHGIPTLFLGTPQHTAVLKTDSC